MSRARGFGISVHTGNVWCAQNPVTAFTEREADAGTEWGFGTAPTMVFMQVHAAAAVPRVGTRLPRTPLANRDGGPRQSERQVGECR